MSEFRTIALAEVGTEDLSPPFPVLYTGKFNQKGRDIPVSESDLDSAVRNFNAMKARGYEPPIDVEHRHALGQDAPAVGYYKELVRKGKQLLARVQWNDDAKAQITSGARRYFSPEFDPQAKDETGKHIGFTLLSGALVSRPHLKGLGPVAMSEAASTALAHEAMEFPVLMTSGQSGVANSYAIDHSHSTDSLTFSPLTSLASERRPVAEQNTVETPETELAEPKTVTLSEEDHAKLTEQVGQVATLSEQVKTLSEQVKASDAALLAERRDADLAQARREGRIDAKDETTTKWNERYEKFGRDEAKALLFELPAETVPMSETGHGQDKPIDAEVPDETDERAFRANVRAEEIAAEKGIEFSEAASIAYREVYG